MVAQHFAKAGVILALVSATLFSTPLSHAAIASYSAHSLQIKHDVTIAATPAKIYEAVLQQVGSWWNPQHSYTKDGKNLSIEARPGGCFCEKFPEGGGIEHLRVIYLAPNKAIRFQGALGPFQANGVAGTLTLQLTKLESADSTKPSTKLELTYSFGGFMDGSFEKIAPAADFMLSDVLGRLKNFVETGEPAKAK